MGKNANFVSHKKSKQKNQDGSPKLPVASALVEGEIAINFGKDVETLSIKNESGDVVTFSSDNYYTEKKLGSGFTGENSGVTVTEALENIEITVDQDFSNTASTNPISTKAVYSAVTENELVWTNAFVALSGTVSAHTANTEIHVTTADKTNWNAKLDASAIVDFFDDAKYEDSGTTKVINFYHGNTIKATIDASDFIVDGMVDDVRIENGNLVIDFNTASGKQDISIPLTDIFDPSNYYNKTAIDNLVGSGFTSSSITEVIIENEKIVSAALNDLYERKLDASAYTPSVELWVSGSGVNSAVLKGGNNTASGTSSVAEGSGSNAIGNYSHAEGHATANGNTSHAEGGGQAYGSFSHAEGRGTASGDTSHAEGTGTQANGESSHAEGSQTSATSYYSHAEGYYTTASGSSSHAEGYYSKAYGNYGSHAEGNNTTANGNSSHAEGYYSKAYGNYGSHAEGQNTIASGNISHAEGTGTQANGGASHAEGKNTKAIGNTSHAEGYNTKASGDYSHTEGAGTQANNMFEHASGQYNVSNSATTTFGDSGNTLFSVGNGTADNARHNAFEIRQNGDIYITSGNSDIKLQDYIGGSVETVTAITPSNSGSTDPIATKVVAENELTVSNALNDLNARLSVLEAALGGMALRKVTQAEYDALTVKDPNTLYIIND